MGKVCRCNGRLLCMCLLPCMMTGHLVVYIMVSIFVTISYTPPPKPNAHYIAPGTYTNSGNLAPQPVNPFWNLRLEDSALWNQLQHAWDRQFNPILQRNGTLPPKAKVVSQVENECTSDCPSNACSVPHRYDLNSFPEQIRAFIRSMHCREYTLIINQPDMCREGNVSIKPMLLMAIKSQVGNFENRQAIRETWGRSGNIRGEASGRAEIVRRVFLLGRQDLSSDPHPDLNNLLALENQKYNDILQWDFRDSFFNLTLKDVLFWDWLQQYCPSTIFVFKGDDDVFVRTSALLDYLQRHYDDFKMYQPLTNETLDLFVGDVIYNAVPNRDPSTKYYIPDAFYKGRYPPYAGGGGVVYSGSLALRMKEVSERLRLFPIDDVYLGMCMNRLGLCPSHHSGFLTLLDLPTRKKKKPCAYKSVLLIHRRSPNEMLWLWRITQGLFSQC